MKDYFSLFPIKSKYFFLLFSVIFITLILTNYFYNRSLLKNAIHAHQISIAQGVAKRIEEWTNGKINSINAISEIVENLNDEQNKDQIRDILVKGARISGFSSMYVGYENNHIISGRIWEKPSNYIVSQRPWYRHTLSKQAITINDPYIDAGLQSLVISICTPMKKNQQGVLCGILALDEVKQEILDMSLPKDGYAFLVNNEGQIIFHPNKSEEVMQLDNVSLNHLLHQKEYSTSEDILSFSKVKNTDWYIITKVRKAAAYAEVNRQFFINFFIYILSTLLFFLINFFYNFNQREISQKLKKSKELLQKFINHSSRGILIGDQNDNIVFYNEKFLHLTHIAQKEIATLKVYNIDALFYRCTQQTQKELLDLFEYTKAHCKEGEMVFEIIDTHKIAHHYYINMFPLFDENNVYEGLLLSYHEITQKYLEEQQSKIREEILIQQSKMADLGEMIGAISHQWKQPLNALSILLGNLLQFKQLGKLDATVFQENLNRSLENVHYLGDTIDTFRHYYQPQRQAARFDIDKAIEQTIFILQPHLKNKNIEITIENTLESTQCFNFKNEFQQIMTNLIVNAKDALSESVSIKEKTIFIFLSDKEDNFEVSISDNAAGIKEEMLEHLFKPFKTSKGEHGTGNGLYISRLIAREKLEGELILESAKDPTRFLLTFPKMLKGVSTC